MSGWKGRLQEKATDFLVSNVTMTTMMVERERRRRRNRSKPVMVGGDG